MSQGNNRESGHRLFLILERMSDPQNAPQGVVVHLDDPYLAPVLASLDRDVPLDDFFQDIKDLNSNWKEKV